MKVSAHADGLGIMAPGAVHIAAFQKNCSTNARAVVQGEPLYFRNHAFHLSHISPLPVFSVCPYEFSIKAFPFLF